jgi:signal transduction histidine kinase/ligand-binding sensor domain-containing protein/AraC-like DNA-binding protein
VRRIILILSIVLNQWQILFADSESVKIEDYSYKDGLTTSSVFSSYRDSKGFLWLCTMNGLFRYDGYTFRNINTLIEDKLNCGTFCTTEDTDHNFWIGTTTGIYFYNTHTERLFPVKLNLDKNLRCLQILIIKNKIWVASNIGLLLINSTSTFNPDTKFHAQLFLPDSMHNRTPQDNIINTIYYTPESSSLWVGTNGALYEFNLQKLVFKYINSYFQNSIRCIAKYNNNIIVSSWDGGVFLVNPHKHLLENDPFINEVNKTIGDKRIMSAVIDNQNRLWVASYNSGLYIFEKSKNGTVLFSNYRNDQRQQENLKSDFINQMYIDNNGIAWLCMNQLGLSKVFFQKSNLKYINFIKQNSDHDSKEIVSVNQSTDKNKLWIATNGGGIYLFDTKSHNFKQFTNKSNTGIRLQSNEVSSCHQDSKGNLWIVYRRIGLYVLPSKVVFDLINNNTKAAVKPIDANLLLSKDSRSNSYITSFFDDSDGRLWIGAWGSLNVVELKQDISMENLISSCKITCIFNEEMQNNINFPISPVLSILEIKKKQYLLGMFGVGIVQIDEISKNNFRGIQITLNKRLPTKNINLITKDESNGIWIGTNSGLYYWNLKTDKLISITTKDGLSSDNITNIIKDKHSNFWVSTSYGISEIHSKNFSVTNYFYTDKDKFNQYIMNAGMLSPRGLVYFSTNDAIVKVNPDSIDISKQNAPLYFTDIKIDNKTVTPSEKCNGTYVIDANINECKSINVPYNHTLSIEFAALDFINSGRFLYKYRIGNNNEWIILNSNQRSLSLPNIKPGKYRLSLMLANSQNKNNIRSIKINYLPPFWQSKPAVLCYFVVLLILFFIYRWLATQRLLQKSIIEMERYERKKLEELDKMKSEFFSNISHEFRTPLSLIINPLEKFVKDEDIPLKKREKLNIVLKSSNRLLKLTNELMDFSKIEKKLLVPEFQLCEIVSFLNEICHLFDILADRMDIDYKLNSSFDQLEIQVDKGMVEKVIFNLLSNAFKYTPAYGMIMVNISTQNELGIEFLKISVVNTGEGIDKENLEKIFDRYYQIKNVQNRNIEGTGIGLALVKSFVELHNGKVEVKSESNVETCFDVILPVKQLNFNSNDEISFSREKNDRDISLTFLPKTGENKPTSHYRLLLVEDDEDIKNYIVDELSIDFKITTAKNGKEGINIANEMIPDLIITDIIMPVLTGIELCKIIKNKMVTSHIPIIILSAKTNVAEQIEGLEMGADVYMIKPFNIDQLKIQILRLIHFKETIYSRYLKETTLIPQGALSTRLDEEFMKKIIDFIEENLTNVGLNIEQLANCVSLSKVQVYRKVKAISGMPAVEFIRTIRLKKAAQMILGKRLNLTEIAFETGFSSQSYFSKCFHDHFGKSPSDFAIDYGNK